MSLTKQDLRAIKGIVEETVEVQLESKLEEKLDSKLEEKLESKLKPLKKDIHYIKKTLNLMIERYDPMVVDHERRLDKVETVLKIGRQ